MRSQQSIPQKLSAAHRTPEQTKQLLQGIGFNTSLNYSLLLRLNEELEVRARYLPFVRNIGMTDLAGFMDISNLPEPIWKSDFEYWDFTRVEPGSVVNVPRSVYNKCALAHEAEIPCAGLVVIHQHVLAPEVEIEYVIKEQIIYVP